MPLVSNQGADLVGDRRVGMSEHGDLPYRPWCCSTKLARVAAANCDLLNVSTLSRRSRLNTKHEPSAPNSAHARLFRSLTVSRTRLRPEPRSFDAAARRGVRAIEPLEWTLASSFSSMSLCPTSG